MRHVDDDAEPVHAADSFGAKRRQAAMHRRRGLDVAGLVDQVVGELDANARRAPPERPAGPGRPPGSRSLPPPAPTPGRRSRMSSGSRAMRGRWPRSCQGSLSTQARHSPGSGSRTFSSRFVFGLRRIIGRSAMAETTAAATPPGAMVARTRAIDRAGPIGPAGMGVHVDDHGHPELQSVVGE